MRARHLVGTTRATVPDVLVAVLIAALTVIAAYNPVHYMAVSGFDAQVDLDYAYTLVTDWRIPTELANYYTPPGFFLLAGPRWKQFH